MLNFEQIDIYDEKPNLEIDASTKRTKFIIQDNDTIRKYIDLEIIDHVDRRIIRTYNEDGTLYEINTIIILSSNKILEIQAEVFEQASGWLKLGESDKEKMMEQLAESDAFDIKSIAFALPFSFIFPGTLYALIIALIMKKEPLLPNT